MMLAATVEEMELHGVPSLPFFVKPILLLAATVEFHPFHGSS